VNKPEVAAGKDSAVLFVSASQHQCPYRGKSKPPLEVLVITL